MKKFKLHPIGYFVLGAIAVNASSVLSNSTSSEQLLTSAISQAVQQVESQRKAEEEESLSKLPNILECQNMQWMQNCTEINNQAKKNPSAPIRVSNKAGIEYNFVPGTPSAVIRLQLEQSPEAAEAYVSYVDETWGEYKNAASLFQMALWKRGELQNVQTLDESQKEKQKTKPIDTSALSISVFVESTCGVCDRYLGNLSAIQSKYPSLKIKVFQIDQDATAYKRKVTDRGLVGRILSKQEVQKISKLGVNMWPITWVDNMKTKRREELIGNKTASQLETRFLSITFAQNSSTKQDQ